MPKFIVKFISTLSIPVEGKNKKDAVYQANLKYKTDSRKFDQEYSRKTITVKRDRGNKEIKRKGGE